MTYKLRWTSQASNCLAKLQQDIAVRIHEKIVSIAENPFRYLEHYSGKNLYKFRIGDYRALVDVNIKRNIIFVRVIEKRSKIYKR